MHRERRNMINKTKYCVVFVLLLILYTQDGYTSDGDSIIIKAMQDELNRNMQELRLKNYADPFYISYTLADINTLYTSASLGALLYADTTLDRTWFIRVLTGNYQLNDENFSGEGMRNGNIEYLGLPLDNDYYGIRRSFWVATDNVYKSASQTYKNKMLTLEKNKMDADDLPIADFSKEEMVHIRTSDCLLQFDFAKYKNLVKEVSEEFLSYPDIVNSSVSLFGFSGKFIFINSEGTQTSIISNILALFLQASMLNEDGLEQVNQLVYYYTRPEEVPEAVIFKEDAKQLVSNLKAVTQAPRFDDYYAGPVLFLNQSVGEILLKDLFNGNNSLIAYREPLYSTAQMSLFYGSNEESLENKINRKIFHENINITAYPYLNEYKQTTLIGSFEVDAEGVKPPDTLMLVENGFLRTLLNGRTPTRYVPQSNGHNRYAIGYRAMSRLVGPGVMEINYKQGKNIAELKQELIAHAKSEGLDYAIIVKPMQAGSTFKPINIYKINLETGKEKLVSSSYFNPLPKNFLKDILGASENKTVYNTFYTGSGFGEDKFTLNDDNGAVPSGLPVSLIIPDALLLREVEVSKSTKPLTKNLPIIDSPVKSAGEKAP